MEVSHKEKLSLQASEVIDSMTQAGMAMAIWKLPMDTQIHLLASSTATGHISELDLVDGAPAFAVGPFSSTDRKAYILPSDFISSWELGNVEDQNEAFQKLTNTFNLDIGKGKAEKSQSIDQIITAKESDVDQRLAFENTVLKAVEQIEKGHFDKVVISRKKDFTLKQDLNVFHHFQQLTQRYPEAFVSLVYLPWLEEFWLGASPEVLVHQEDQTFKTVSLAGTQSSVNTAGQEISMKEALWSQKEIEEQALVSRYIINRFKTVRVREFKEVGPRTVKAGKLLHLKSTFEVKTNEIGFKEMPSVMLGLLHPTSAVCGLPKETALSFIKEHEAYDRSFYSGFLGPVNINGSSQLFVNLRNLKKHKNTITTYAGCGITADSNPAKEWLETELKMNTILGI